MPCVETDSGHNYGPCNRLNRWFPIWWKISMPTMLRSSNTLWSEQVVAHRSGPAGAKGEVVVARALFVGVAFDQGTVLHVAQQPVGLIEPVLALQWRAYQRQLVRAVRDRGKRRVVHAL